MSVEEKPPSGGGRDPGSCYALTHVSLTHCGSAFGLLLGPGSHDDGTNYFGDRHTFVTDPPGQTIA